MLPLHQFEYAWICEQGLLPTTFTLVILQTLSLLSSAYHFLFIHLITLPSSLDLSIELLQQRELRFRLLCRPNPDPTTCLPRHVDRWAFSSFLELMKSPSRPSSGPPNLWSYLFSNQSWEHYFWRLLSTIGFKIWLMFNLFQCANVLVKTAKPTWFSLPGLCWVAQGSKIWILSPVTQALQWHSDMRILLAVQWLRLHTLEAHKLKLGYCED